MLVIGTGILLPKTVKGEQGLGLDRLLPKNLYLPIIDVPHIPLPYLQHYNRASLS
jgi:hypothetical protein